MASTIRIKRRLTGAAGAPSSLENAELAFNEVDNTLYYGKGTGGAGGSATTIEAIAGKGAYVDKASTQTITGDKTFSGAVVVPTPTAGNHAVTKDYADGITPDLTGVAMLASPAFTGNPTAPTQSTGDDSTKLATTAFVKAQGYVTASSAPVLSVAGKTGAVSLVVADVSGAAPLASPAFTGLPTAPTQTAGDDSTKVATTSFVQAAITAVVGAAPGALDTLVELATALGNDADFSGTVTTSLASKLVKASNLSDLTNVATARTNLGLGSMAVQSASSVAITGGTIDGVTLDAGSY